MPEIDILNVILYVNSIFIHRRVETAEIIDCRIDDGDTVRLRGNIEQQKWV